MKNIEELNKQIEADSQNSEYYYERAMYYYDILSQEEQAVDTPDTSDLAVKDVNKAIELSPDNALYHELKGDLYMSIDGYEQAQDSYMKSIILNPESKTVLDKFTNTIAKQLEKVYTKEECIIAIDDYTKAIEIDPDDKSAYSSRAAYYSRLEQYEKAIEDYTKVIEIDPDDKSAYSSRASCYSKIKQYEHAIEGYKKAIELAPDDSSAYSSRASCYSKLKQYEQAIEDYTKAIELVPDDLLAYIPYMLRGSCYSKIKQYEHAIEDYTKAIELAPDNMFSYLYRGSLYTSLLQFEQSIEDYTKAIELAQEYGSGYGFLHSIRALSYSLLKHYEQAIKDCTKALELNPNDGSAFATRASCYFELKQYELAIEGFTKAIELDPNSNSYLPRASCYQKLEQYEQAIDDCTKAIELEPDNSLAYLTRASCYQKLEQYEQAIDDCTKAIELEPDFSIAYVTRASCYVVTNRWEDAYEDLKQVKNNWDSFINEQMPLFEIAVDYGSMKKEVLIALKSPVGALYGIMTKFNHEWMLKVLQLFFDLDKFSFFTDEFYELARLIDNLDSDISDYPQELKALMIKLLDMSDEYDEKEHEIERQFTFKINIIKAIIQKVSYENDSKDLSKEEYKHYSEMQNLFTNVLLGIVGLMTDKIRDAEEEKAKAIIEAQIKERNEVIAKLSHSIKNLIRSAVIDPLSYMQSLGTLNEKNLSDALKGANLIREIANGINLSLKGSFDDFVHDAQNSSNDGYIVKDMFYDCFKFAVSNMLDGKYFNVFMREYFNEREKYQTALSEWDKISQTNTSADILNFIKLNMLDIDFNFKLDEQLAIGNEKGSAIKLLILFQEIIFNAVKYSSFVNRDNRNMFISIHEEDDNIVLLVENNLNPEIQAKSSGLGSVIIDNFAKLLSGKLDIDKTNNRFKLKLTFPNIWNRKGE